MLRHLVLLLILFSAISISPAAKAAMSATTPSQLPTVVGPNAILYVDADSIYYIRSVEWWSKNVRHQEKLLLTSIRMKYWADHLPADMAFVFDQLGFPTGRVLLTPVGHAEEWWYYSQMSPPLRFRDGILLDPDRLAAALED